MRLPMQVQSVLRNVEPRLSYVESKVISADVKACVRVTSANAANCLTPYKYCETVSNDAWNNNNHNTCTAIKANARAKYNAEHPGCNGQTNDPCFQG